MLKTSVFSLVALCSLVTTAWAEKPDLTVVEIKLNSECYAQATIHNNGGAISQEEFENARLSFVLGTQVWSQDLTRFDEQALLRAPNGRLTRVIQTPPIQSNRMKVEVDSAGATGAIDESNESNNHLWVNLTCPSYDPEEFGEPVIAPIGWRLLDDCSIEAEFQNKGPGKLDPDAYGTQSGYGKKDRVIASVTWADVSRTNVYIREFDPQRKLQEVGGRVKYTFRTNTLGNKVFKGTEVRVRTYTLRNDRDRAAEVAKTVWCAPDLSVVDIRHKPTRLVAKQRGWLKVKVRNRGWITSRPTTMTLRLGGESTPMQASIPALKAGKSHYVNREFKVDRMGGLIVTATVDPQNRLPEAKDDNNVKKQVIVINAPPGKPDLVVSNLSLNAQCQVMVQVKNNGPGWVPMKVWDRNIKNNADVYIWRDGKTWGGADIRAFDPMRRLQAPGGTATFTSNLKVGRSKIRAIVDNRGRVPEARDNNNALNRELDCAKPTLKPIRRAPARRPGTDRRN